ncbi:MAG: hypothetical protein H6706_04015 [Myxococcales bacterium]|nr:hypothetical protein [Myxococcales bacterium]
MTTALSALRVKREAELAAARAEHEAASRVVGRLEAQLGAEAPPGGPRPGEVVDVALEAQRQAHLSRTRARRAAEAAALDAARQRQQAAHAALVEALRGVKAVDVLEARAAQPALAAARRRQAADIEDRNRR